MLNALTRHDIQVLRRAEVPQEKAALLTGASVRSVRRIDSSNGYEAADYRFETCLGGMEDDRPFQRGKM